MARRGGMTIAELEKKSGIRRSTIHHYVRSGLLHQPYKTGQTMAYYDQSHLRRLEIIQKIKLDFLKTAKTTRVPLDFIMHKMNEGYTLTKSGGPTVRPLNKKNRDRAQKKKEEIIEATLKLYADRGYYLTNIRDIAREVGMSGPAFYHYFQDKRELFVEVIEYVVRNYRQEVIEALKKEKNPVERSKIMFLTFSKQYPKIGEILNQLRAGVAIGDEWARERLSRLYGEMTKNVYKELSVGIENGVIRDVDPELLAFFNVFFHELAVHRASIDDKYTTQEVVAFVADMLYHAFLTEKGKKILGAFNRSST